MRPIFRPFSVPLPGLFLLPLVIILFAYAEKLPENTPVGHFLRITLPVESPHAFGSILAMMLIVGVLTAITLIVMENLPNRK